VGLRARLIRRHTNPRVPALLLVTDRHATAGRDLETVVVRALDAGLPAVQLRDRDLPGRMLFALADRLRVATRRTGALFFVNDRVDVARAVDADGVQVGASTLPVDVARTLLTRGALVGESTHAIDEIRATRADFVVFGPVYDTPSKRVYGPPQGDRIHEALAASLVPLIAIGGIESANADPLRAAGVHGFAVIRAILAAPDPAAATRALLNAR
jgi:thiamine-phosphate pyrophosphorylase